jgi:hypothetical protein
VAIIPEDLLAAARHEGCIVRGVFREGQHPSGLVWAGHPPDKLKAMREHLDELKRSGTGDIDD